MKHTICYILMFYCVLFLISETNIVEKVDVDWWVVPLFAVDSNGHVVNQLTSEDIELYVNRKKIENFTLYSRSFSVSKDIKDEKIFPIERKDNIVFLIFDIAYRIKSNQDRAKEIAIEMIKKNVNNTKFVIMVLDPFAGLKYEIGPSSNKNELIEIVEKKVKMLPRSRNPFIVMQLAGSAQIVGNKGNKLSNSDIKFLAEELASGLKNTDQNFFFSFESLYYSLNQIIDNKFIYFFSEGLTHYARKAIRHAEGEYYKNLKKSADYLGKSGAVIFVVDVTGFGIEDHPLRSGKASLEYLANEAGGEYLRGNKKSVSTKLENMNRSYYEIAFSDTDLSGIKIKRIDIVSKRKGMKIISIKTMEKKKDYKEMSDIEKELLAVNIISNSNLFSSPFSLETFKIVKLEQSMNSRKIQIKIPNVLDSKKVDVYTVWISSDLSVNTIVKKNRIFTAGNILEMEVEQNNGNYGKILIVDEDIDKAYILETPEFSSLSKYLKKEKNRFLKYKKRMTESENIELDKVLIRTAGYTKKLERSVFHYFCREEIVEVIKEIGLIKEKKESKYDNISGRMVSKRVPGQAKGNVLHKKKKKNVFDYQLLQNGEKIIEQRKQIGKISKTSSETNLNLDSFISRKIVLTPVAILSLMNQKNYDFILRNITKFKGVKVAVLEVFPKNFKSVKSIFGKVFIDLSDYSIVRMEINPGSIGGFEKIIKLAKRLGSSIELRCNIDFGLKRNGIRFPTQVKISEKYRNGNFLRSILKLSEWERSKIIYKYTDYKFFNVDTEVQVLK